MNAPCFRRITQTGVGAALILDNHGLTGRRIQRGGDLMMKHFDPAEAGVILDVWLLVKTGGDLLAIDLQVHPVAVEVVALGDAPVEAETFSGRKPAVQLEGGISIKERGVRLVAHATEIRERGEGGCAGQAQQQEQDAASNRFHDRRIAGNRMKAF